MIQAASNSVDINNQRVSLIKCVVVVVFVVARKLRILKREFKVLVYKWGTRLDTKKT